MHCTWSISGSSPRTALSAIIEAGRICLAEQGVPAPRTCQGARARNAGARNRFPGMAHVSPEKDAYTMPLNCGIVGLPNIGKSTIFNALTAAKAQAANYP